MGAQVRAYDPVSNEVCANTRPELNIQYCDNIGQLACAGALGEIPPAARQNGNQE